jgi:hypothetical protein
LTATPAKQVIRLEWLLYGHPAVAGYDVHRRQAGEPYPGVPYAQVGRMGRYADANVVAGQVYSYTVRSRDLAGNVHQAAQEVSAVVQMDEPPAFQSYLPLIVGASK